MKRQTCYHEGCSKAPSFGFPNEERVSCSAHKRPGQEYLAGKAEHHRGGAGDALTLAMGHVPKGLDYRHTADRKHDPHHTARAAGDDGKHCQETGCMRAPSYGWEGAAVMCALHKRPAMVYLRHPSDSSSSGKGSAGVKPTAEKGHVPKGLEYIPSVTMDSDRVVHSDHPHCAFKGCTKAPSYGTEGQGGVYCFTHKRPGQVFLKRGTKPAGTAAAAAAAAAAATTVPSESMRNRVTASAESDDLKEQEEGSLVAVEADLAEVQRCVALSRRQGEDSSVGLKYLRNVLNHPDDIKYRTLKISNKKFYTEVWLNSGMRGLFLALGFRKRSGGIVGLDPLAPNTLDCVAVALQGLEAGWDASPATT